MNRLTVEDVLWIHDRELERGGKAGVLSPDALPSALDSPFQTFDGVDLCPTIEEKAAALAFYLIKGHYFFDGNKRTAFVSMAVFLKINGFVLDTDWMDAEPALLRLAADEMSRDEWVEWVRSHSVVE